MKLLLHTCLLLFFGFGLLAQDSGEVYTNKDTASTSGFFYKSLGFKFRKNWEVSDGHDAENILFQEVSKLHAPFSYIMFPVIGEMHFTDYTFVTPESGVFKYAYFTGTGEFHPSLYLFDSDANSSNLRLTFGTRIRIWDKRRPPLRSNFIWEPSHAILTPSYVPGAYYSRRLKTVIEDERKIVYGLELGYTHHSNGQDAPTLAALDTTLLLPDSYIYNINDGDFSTNYINIAFTKSILYEESVRLHHLNLIFDGIGKYRPEHDDLIKYKINYRYRFFSQPTQMRSDTKPNYRQCFEIEVGLGLIDFNSFDIDRSLSFAISYHYLLPYTHKIYGFATYAYLGQDNYNIYLEHQFHMFRFGLATIIN